MKNWVDAAGNQTQVTRLPVQSVMTCKLNIKRIPTTFMLQVHGALHPGQLLGNCNTCKENRGTDTVISFQ